MTLTNVSTINIFTLIINSNFVKFISNMQQICLYMAYLPYQETSTYILLEKSEQKLFFKME